jgi:hypothetical protein
METARDWYKEAVKLTPHETRELEQWKQEIVQLVESDLTKYGGSQGGGMTTSK